MVKYRSTAMSTNGMVASAHSLASLSGLGILVEGGNAFDAAIATNAALNVTLPNACGIGGDLFCLIFDSSMGKVQYLNASGRASRNASIGYYSQHGFEKIPNQGILSAIEVPGCVGGWFEILEKFGTLPIERLLRDAISLAKDGFPVSHHLSSQIRDFSNLGSNKEWSMIYASDGNGLRPGETLKQQDLAWSLSQIAKKGRGAFYEGDIAEKFERSMKAHGGLIDLEDMASNRAEWSEPVSTEYRQFRIYETAPNSQAITALIAFNILEEFDLPSLELGSAEQIELMVEASRAAYGYRDRYITDPSVMSKSNSELLDKALARQAAERIRKGIGKQTMRSNAKISREDDTTYFTVVDKDRNVVSCIQSLYNGFGSGFVPEGTGIVLQNRGSYFSLDYKHHNALAPRKRTFHTLCASLTTKDSQPYFAFGCMGGDIQPQIHLQVISSVLDHGTDIQQAIEDPRWAELGTIYEKNDTIHLESRFSTSVVDHLKKSGYKVEIEEDLWPTAGIAQGIIVSEKRDFLSGGADPRGDGLALGY